MQPVRETARLDGGQNLYAGGASAGLGQDERAGGDRRRARAGTRLAPILSQMIASGPASASAPLSSLTVYVAAR